MLGTIAARAPELETVVAVESVRKMREDLRPAKVDVPRRRLLPPVHERVDLAAQGRGAHAREPGGQRAVDHAARAFPASATRGTAAPRGCRSITTWGSSASSSRCLPRQHGDLPAALLALPHSGRRGGSRPSPGTGPRSRSGPTSRTRSASSASAGARSRALTCPGGAWRGAGPSSIRAENLRAFAPPVRAARVQRQGVRRAVTGMAESTLAISFSTRALGTGVRTDSAQGEALLGEAGRAEPVKPDDPGAAAIVRCGSAFPGDEIQVFAPDDEASEHGRSAVDRQVRRDPAARAQPDERLLQPRAGADARAVRRRLA